MKSSLSLALLFFIQFHLVAQDSPNWINITGNSGVGYAHFKGDSIWVGFDGGISWIDYNSGELLHNLNSGNSALQGNSIRELVVNDNGEAWFLGHQVVTVSTHDHFQTLQYYDGQNVVSAATNLNVLDPNSSLFDLILVSDNELIFREETDKIWRLMNQELVELESPEGYTVNRLMSNDQGVVFAELDNNTETLLIGVYEENNWIIYDLQDYIQDEFGRFISSKHYETGPDGKFYLNFCTDENCFLVNYDNQTWEQLMILNGSSQFFWSPDNIFHTYSSSWNELREVKNWSYTGETIEMRFPVEHFLSWEQDSTLWCIGDSKLIKSKLSPHPWTGNLLSDDGETIPVGNSILNTNVFDKVAVNSDLLKFVTTSEDELYTFDGINWNQVSLEDYSDEVEPSSMQFLTNNTGETYLFSSNSLLIHDGVTFSEYDLPFTWGNDHCLDLDGDLLMRANGYDNLVSLNPQGEVDETTIPVPDENGSSYVMAQDESVWFFCESCFPRRPYFFDGEWTGAPSPSSTSWNISYGHFAFADSENNVFFIDVRNQLIKYNLDLEEFEVIVIPYEEAGIHPFLSKLAEDSKGNIWLSTSGIGLFKYDGNNWTFFDHINAGLSSVTIYDMAIDDNDNIWIGTDNGLSIFNEEGIASLGTSQSKRLEGKVYFDLDNNGEFMEDIDVVAENTPLYIHPFENLLFSNSEGEFGSNVLPEVYTVELLPIKHWKVDGNIEKQVTINNEDKLDVDFRLIPDTIFDEARVYISGNPSRCDELINYYVFVENTGTTVMDLRVNIETDEFGELFTSNIPLESDSTHIYHYDHMQLKPYESIRFKLLYQVPNYMFLGDTLKWKANVQLLENDIYVNLDSTYFNQEVLCSYDPNDKRAQPTGKNLGQESLIEDELLYTIRFQNTGNDVAYRVEIIDTLDNEFDISTFNIIQNSHPMETYIEEGRIVHFVFDNINLPDSTSNEIESHGFIQYTITADQSLMLPIEVTNTANIYFDNNPAIVTNTTQNTLVECLPFNESSTNIILNDGESYFLPDGTEVTESGNYETDILDNEGCIIEKIYTNLEVLTSVNNLPLDRQIEIFPNPNNGVFNINLKGSLPSILRMSLINITGQEVYTQQIEFEDNNLEFEDLPNGLYTIKFVDNFGKVRAIKKVVIHK